MDTPIRFPTVTKVISVSAFKKFIKKKTMLLRIHNVNNVNYRIKVGNGAELKEIAALKLRIKQLQHKVK